MLKHVIRGVEIFAICFIWCLFVPRTVEAGESVTGGERWPLAVEVDLEKEYTTTTADGWVKIHAPANTVCIGVGFDQYTSIRGQYQTTDGYTKDLESEEYGYVSKGNIVMLGQQTSYWDGPLLQGDRDYYFHVMSEKTDSCTFKFICETRDTSTDDRRLVEINKNYEDLYYIYGISFNKFVAPTSGKYKVIVECQNGTAGYDLMYRDGEQVQPIYNDNGIEEKDVFYLEQGLTYHLSVKANPAYGSTSKVRCSFLISNTKVSNITLNESNITLNKGGQALLTASVLPELAVDKSVTYASSNPSVAIVSEDGMITAIKGGTATITVTANDGSGVQAGCQVNVLPVFATRLELDKSSATWDIAKVKKKSCQVTANVYPADVDDNSVTFTSSNPNIVSVEAKTGLLTPYKAGTAVITCKTNDGSNLSQSCTVTFTQSHLKGEKKTVNKIKYKVTSNTYGGGTVAVYGVSNKNQTSYQVPNTVKIDGYSYKVTEIGKKAFANLKKVKKVTLGTNIKTIGNEAFYNSKKLKTLTIQSKKLTKVGKNALKNIDAKATVIVPASKLSKYKKLFKDKGQKSTVKIKKN